MKNLNEKLKYEKGITLIALVVTIIVLLILAGISISMLTGQNGILKRATEAKEETQIASEDELRKLTALEAATNIECTTHKDSSTGEEKTVKIPAGFAVSQVDGENTIADGLVVIDKNENEFVWVPVKDYDKFVRKAGYENGVLQDMTNYGEANQDGINDYREESEVTKKEAQDMYASVNKYGGFYIGRYETGIEDKKAVVKKDSEVYTNIAWSASEEDMETEFKEGGAIEVSRSFDELYGYKDTETTLCYGVQWDATISYIDFDYTGYAKDSTGKGNYNSESIINTGSNSNYKLKNIYDMAGNAIEWTMESNKKSSKTGRGSSYTNDGFKYPSSTRAILVPRRKSESLGFRITMFMK